jgi:hypothetical protein
MHGILWCEQLVAFMMSLHSELTSYALLSLCVSCLFVPVECWFITFENVGCRTMCKHKILCFAIQISFRDILNA